MAVVVPRGDVQYVVTEYGVVNLFGKSLQERAIAMISVAHPDFRDELFESRPRTLGLLGSERTLAESIKSVYPMSVEETVTIGRSGGALPAGQAPPTSARSRSISTTWTATT